MTEVLEGIKSAAEDGDNETLQDIFAEMNDYRIPKGFSELWTSIKTAADAGDYSALIALLNRNEK